MLTELDTSGIRSIVGLSPSDLERRKKFITASDLPAVFGLDTYRDPVSVWLDKMGMLTPDESTDAAHIGLAAESGVLRMIEAAVGRHFDQTQPWRSKGVVGATPDALMLLNGPVAVGNAKTSGRVDDWESGPPARVVIQATAEMWVSDAEFAYIGALLGGFGPLKFRAWKLDRDDKTAQDLAEVASAWFEKHVVRGTKPEGAASLDTVKRIIRTANKVAAVEDSKVQHWLDCQAHRKEADKTAKALKDTEDRALSEILTDMGDAEAGQCAAGVLTYMTTNRKGYTVEPVAFRQARWKSNEEGGLKHVGN